MKFSVHTGYLSPEGFDVIVTEDAAGASTSRHARTMLAAIVRRAPCNAAGAWFTASFLGNGDVDMRYAAITIIVLFASLGTLALAYGGSGA